MIALFIVLISAHILTILALLWLLIEFRKSKQAWISAYKEIELASSSGVVIRHNQAKQHQTAQI